MKKVQIIKRYKNRKLYDTLTSKYVTLDEITKLIELSDVEIMVIDNETMNDMTNHTLMALLLHQSNNGMRPNGNVIKNLIIENFI